MSDRRLERDLREVLTMDAPDGAPAELRDRVRNDLARQPAPRGRAAWFAAAAGLAVLIGTVAVMGRSFGVPPAASETPGRMGSQPRSASNSTTGLATATVTARPSLPSVADTIEHPGLLAHGQLFDRDHGFAETDEGRLLLTDSGGARWRDGAPPGSSASASLVPWFLDAAHGWIAELADAKDTNFVLWRTVDGAVTWTRSEFPGVHSTLADLGFLDENVGWLGTDPGGQKPKPELRWTYDGGATWSEPIDLAAAMAEPTFPAAIAFVDRDRGFAADASGLRRTDNGGRSWTVVDLPQRGLRGTLFPSTPEVLDSTHLVLWATERHADFTVISKVIYASADAGATWHVAEQLRGDDQLSISFLDPLHWIGSDGKRLSSTSDGGATWLSSPELRVSGLPARFERFGLLMTDTQVGVALVVPGSPCVDFGCPFTTSELFKTTDGARSWTRLGDCDPKSDYRFVCLPPTAPGATPGS
jgi:photosystem II stability/assembly factor-like uncharacterized protein